ncbi:cell division protein ZapA [Polaromonas glacialis]|uniref:cell division protein ZapA n=1 Tax=Polaromonas glacialis TaxID=866564 RepID=UPI0004953014|nr:cell division protein ZapA [Polaromonas glacialis]
MKQLEVQIMGQNYMLGCPENSETRLLEAVETVDSAMCKIRDAGKVKARDRIAVLAALNLAYQLLEPAPAPPEPALQSPAPKADTTDGASEASRAQLQSLLQKLDTALASQNFKA